jgi:pyrroloquinoline quinone biosynthesis protein D
MPSIAPTRKRQSQMMHEIRMASRPRLASRVRSQWEPVREQQVLLAPEGVLVLNATASAILALCDGQRSVSAITSDLSTQYNRVVDQEILTFLNRLLQRRLIEFDDEN